MLTTTDNSGIAPLPKDHPQSSWQPDPHRNDHWQRSSSIIGNDHHRSLVTIIIDHWQRSSSPIITAMIIIAIWR
jgi:hypothetical protein